MKATIGIFNSTNKMHAKILLAVMLFSACFYNVAVLAQNAQIGQQRNRNQGENSARQSTGRAPSVLQQMPATERRQGQEGTNRNNVNRNDISRGPQIQNGINNRNYQDRSNRDYPNRGNINLSPAVERHPANTIRTNPDRSVTRRSNNNINRPGNNYNRPGNNSNPPASPYNRPGDNFNNGSRGNRNYNSNNNYRRPVYSAYNPNWRYAYAPRRNSIFNTLPSSYININFGGFGYRYCDGIYYRPYNNIFRVVAPPFGIFINALPLGYRRIYVRNYPYYYYNGTYYDYRHNNYIVVSPPVGAIVESIPDGFETLIIDGETYYVVDGAQYKPVVQENGEIWYEVIKSNA
ncbi:MAG: hypothetical protein H7Z13_21760 [Ferruginibacter sp.]|nr:hypothetical protein [Ferruginibacter sp.]